MKTRTFGRTGRQVTEIGFGAWPIGQYETGNRPWPGSYGFVSADTGVAVVDRYIDLGGTFIDTARGYGTSESLIGSSKHFYAKRESIFLSTKTGKTGTLEALPGIREDIETSLRNLKTDYVDLYLIHNPPEDPELIKRVIDIFLRLKDEGKAVAIGASITGPDVTPQVVELAATYIDTGHMDALQLIYSMFRRGHEAIMSKAAAAGVAIIARTVLESGFLTGKYKPEQEIPQEGHRSRWGDKRRRRLLTAAATLAAAVDSPYKSLAQAAIKFALGRPEVSVAIPGAKSVEQVEANCAVDALPELPGKLRAALEALPADIGEIANTD